MTVTKGGRPWGRRRKSQRQAQSFSARVLEPDDVCVIKPPLRQGSSISSNPVRSLARLFGVYSRFR
jgi:hypothetical protein